MCFCDRFRYLVSPSFSYHFVGFLAFILFQFMTKFCIFFRIHVQWKNNEKGLCAFLHRSKILRNIFAPTIFLWDHTRYFFFFEKKFNWESFNARIKSIFLVKQIANSFRENSCPLWTCSNTFLSLITVTKCNQCSIIPIFFFFLMMICVTECFHHSFDFF